MTTHATGRLRPPFVAGPRLRVAKMLMGARILWLAFRRTWSFKRAVALFKGFLAERRRMRGGRGSTRFARAGGRVFAGLYTPGWPSRAFDRFVDGELAHLEGSPVGLRALILAITRSCPLRCEHCCEWPVLNRGEGLSVPDLVRIVHAFQDRGIAQAFLSGGEPLQREEAVLGILESAHPGTDFWMLSSGWGLTPERARRYRHAGLTGVVLSLDHWEAAEHDRFRGRPGAFAWVERAAAAVREAQLVLCVALCARPSLFKEDGLERYGSVARNLGAAFVEIIEPQAVGRWAACRLDLHPSDLSRLETFAHDINFSDATSQLPLVAYPTAFQRRAGCFGGARRYVYVDTFGTLHPCAFCRESSGVALDPGLDDRLAAMRKRPCAAGLGADRLPPRCAGPPGTRAAAGEAGLRTPGTRPLPTIPGAS